MQTQLTSNLCLVVCLVVCACVRSVRARACVYVRERESNLSIRQVLPISAISLYFITSGGIIIDSNSCWHALALNVYADVTTASSFVLQARTTTQRSPKIIASTPTTDGTAMLVTSRSLKWERTWRLAWCLQCRLGTPKRPTRSKERRPACRGLTALTTGGRTLKQDRATQPLQTALDHTTLPFQIFESATLVQLLEAHRRRRHRLDLLPLRRRRRRGATYAPTLGRSARSALRAATTTFQPAYRATSVSVRTASKVLYSKNKKSEQQ